MDAFKLVYLILGVISSNMLFIEATLRSPGGNTRITKVTAYISFYIFRNVAYIREAILISEIKSALEQNVFPSIRTNPRDSLAFAKFDYNR